MATIGKITRANSGTQALNYAWGKDQLSSETKIWLQEHGVPSELVAQLHDRAVVADGWNVNPESAIEQMAATRKAWQTQGKQVARVIQSFPDSDLSAADPDAWVQANQLGLELAQKAFKDYQVAVYTHIDGVGHKLHNHLVINMPNLQTGAKYHAYRDWEKIAALSNEITQAHGYSVPQNRALERRTMAERQLQHKQAYVWKDDLRQRIDSVMQDLSVSSYQAFSEHLASKGVISRIRGKNVSYAFLDANNKQRRARGTTLGHDYEKEVITHELEQRSQQPDLKLPNLTSEIERTRSQQYRSHERQRTITAEQQTAATKISRITAQRTSLVRASDDQVQSDLKHLQARKSKLREKMEQIERAIPRIIEQLTTNSILARFNQRLNSERQKRQQAEKQQTVKKNQSAKSQAELTKRRLAALKSQQQGRER